MKKLFVLVALVVSAILLGMLAAAPPAAPPAAQPTARQQRRPQSQPLRPQRRLRGETYIPVISKGFQHQFWQSVKMGSEKAAKELNVDITFEGPETEAQVDKQMEMLQTAINKKPGAICFAAVDSKAAIPLLEKAKAAQHPDHRLRLRRGQRHPRDHRINRQHRGGSGCRGQDGGADRQLR